MESNKLELKIYDLYSTLVDLKVILAYEGLFDQQIIKSFLGMTENKLVYDGVEESVRKRLFNILMESLQNIAKHQKSNDEDSKAIFLLGLSDESYYVITGNYIDFTKIDIIKNKLDVINSLDKEGLKELYKNTRLNSVISDVGGAGLGFIDMARKSGNKLDYLFSEKENGTTFFALRATITNN